MAAAETDWQLKRELWLRDSIRQLRDSNCAAISAEARWIPWNLSYLSRAYVFALLDAQALQAFDSFALWLIADTIERR